MRVVVDTSVWVSALLSPQSNARRVLEAFLDERFVLLYNRETLPELRDVSKRPKFKGKIATRQWTALAKAIRASGEPIGITRSCEGFKQSLEVSRTVSNAKYNGSGRTHLVENNVVLGAE